MSVRLGLILAGGNARRFDGRDKGELILDGQRLFDHVQSRLKPQVDEIWLSGHHDYGSGLKVISDLEDGPKGPLAGIYSAYIQVKQNEKYEGILTVPIDGPAFPKDLYCKLSQGGKSCVAHDGRHLHPTFAYWLVSDLKDFFDTKDFAGKLALKTLADHVNASLVKFYDEGVFQNINSKQDLFEARSDRQGNEFK